MSTRLYVENLSFEVSKDDIHELFKEAGAVKSIEILEDPKSADTYLGIVRMVLKEEAEARSKSCRAGNFLAACCE